jgi:transposase-like protein
MFHTRGMNTPPTNPYKCHRFPAEIIRHCVWLYFRFCLRYRDVGELMAARGVILTYEAVRSWGRTFGQVYANQSRRRRPRPGDKWHLDEVFLTIEASGTICGARSTRTGISSIFLCSAGGTRRPREHRS